MHIEFDLNLEWWQNWMIRPIIFVSWYMLLGLFMRLKFGRLTSMDSRFFNGGVGFCIVCYLLSPLVLPLVVLISAVWFLMWLFTWGFVPPPWYVFYKVD